VQAEAGHRLIESTRVCLRLTNDWLAGEYGRAATLIDADTAAASLTLAAHKLAGRLALSPRQQAGCHAESRN